MGWIPFVGIVVLTGIAAWLVWRCQQRLTRTRHTVRCPMHDDPAGLTVLTDAAASPSCRHVDVTACSLQPATAFTPSARKVYLADIAPPDAYLEAVGLGPLHLDEVACGKRCLQVLNAAESGAQPVRCTSGVSDALELVRQTQSPAITRVLWLHVA